MAAPAALPEFKGNVATVLTENYSDMEATALREKERTLKPKVDEINKAVKDKTPTREAADVARQKVDAETFTPRELVILRDNVSNAEFHDLGSARIMSRIGKGLAEAMIQLGAK